jgi:DNA-binding transcriptional LysR family regulator
MLSNVNLNLLLALHALIEERSVTRAGLRLGLSPSAMSHALARLRDLLGDPLFVRSAGQLVPTERAESLAQPLRKLIGDMERIVRDPAGGDGGFAGALRVAMPSSLQPVIAPGIAALMKEEAPKLTVRFLDYPVTGEIAEEGGFDIIVGIFDEIPVAMESTILFEDQAVFVVRKGHPVLQGLVTPSSCARYPFVEVNVPAKPLAEAPFMPRGVEWHVAHTTSSWFVSALTVANSDCVGVLPARLMSVLGASRLVAAGCLSPGGPMRISACWPRRLEDWPEHEWFRRALTRMSSELEPLDALMRRLSRNRPYGPGLRARSPGRSPPGGMRSI